MTTKQAAQAMRDNLKSLKISARVHVGTGSMRSAVYVEAPSANSLFSEGAQQSIKKSAVALGLTLVRGLPIQVDDATSPRCAVFFVA